MSCAGVLLTGGASRRMGRDKATLAPAGGPTLARRTAGLLAGHTSPCVELGPGVSGLDARPDPGGGPLRALAAAAALWAALPADGQVVVVATDLPRLNDPFLAWLVAHPAPGAVVPVAGGRAQPLAARYPVPALRLATETVAAGAARMDQWLAALPAAGIALHQAGPGEWARAAADPEALRDVDTPEDLAAVAGGEGLR